MKDGEIWSINIETDNFGVEETGKDTKRIKEYIENQLREDMMSEQLTLDVVDPFTGNQK